MGLEEIGMVQFSHGGEPTPKQGTAMQSPGRSRRRLFMLVAVLLGAPCMDTICDYGSLQRVAQLAASIFP
jgi:hypothetical protein